MSLRTRVAAAVGLVVFVALAAASAVLYPTLRNNLSANRDRSLIAAVTDTPDQLKAFLQNAATPVTVGSTTLQFITQLKAPSAGSAFVPISARDLQVASGQTGPYFADVTVAGNYWRVYTARMPADPNVLVRAAVPASTLDSTLTELLTLLVAITLGGALLCGLAARLLAGRVLRPVGQLMQTVEQVTATKDLTVPIKSAGRDEIARLARAFAAMMAALDDLVRGQRQLVADASHELRTPLTSLTTNLDLLAEDTGPHHDEAPMLIGEARRQVGELTALVNDLIELARYGRVATHVEDVRLDLVAQQVVARAAARAPRLTFRTEVTPVMAQADPDAVERAVGNLVDNAIKWSPDGGVILVQVSAEGSISVVDQGPGIAAEDLPHVFDRFYRAPAARAMPGSGLGLAIVAQIAHKHGGSVAAEPLDRGVRLRMCLPTTTM